jgi:hypothetical protein
MELYLQKKFCDYIIACETELVQHNDLVNGPTILCNIASAEYELELYRKCIRTCHRAFDLNPNFIRAHFLHLRCLVKLGKGDLCVVLCEAILSGCQGRFEFENVNIMLQIQDLMESVKSKNALQNPCSIDGNNTESTPPRITVSKETNASKGSEIRNTETEAINGIENRTNSAIKASFSGEITEKILPETTVISPKASKKGRARRQPPTHVISPVAESSRIEQVSNNLPTVTDRSTEKKDTPAPPVQTSKSAKAKVVTKAASSPVVVIQNLQGKEVPKSLPTPETATAPALVSRSTPAKTTAEATLSLMPVGTMSKANLEKSLSDYLINEDALVTRTLLKSVRSSLCCAHGEDIVDDMIAFGYLQVNTGEKISLTAAYRWYCLFIEQL